MCKKILAHGIKTLHMYTLNMEKSALAILTVIHTLFGLYICVLYIINVTKDLSSGRILD